MDRPCPVEEKEVAFRQIRSGKDLLVSVGQCECRGAGGWYGYQVGRISYLFLFTVLILLCLLCLIKFIGVTVVNKIT